ncbi:hypothetical protein BO82DRAFT_132979 [Aspergillus uvarum CBS 121591]|uniref:Secreted protein n=1 Tax=Aspergillus uvarum CBS 121591 TaxID=1448315 RepID=A0A319C2U0_9EURO|nr:hypothetical protein BO82DRAFT_132979 [Aspergillus uvarum CBS 121591]PYH79425.1 hypothetical protein BO82DRAFT_132979 [Aspergillus uvarum CBS 121591]
MRWRHVCVCVCVCVCVWQFVCVPLQSERLTKTPCKTPRESKQKRRTPNGRSNAYIKNPTRYEEADQAEEEAVKETILRNVDHNSRTVMKQGGKCFTHGGKVATRACARHPRKFKRAWSSMLEEGKDQGVRESI